MAESGRITCQNEGGIGRIRFFHPKSNSMPGALLRELASTIASEGANAATRVLVLESEGDGPFCAGASFDELRAIGTAEQGLQFFMGFAQVILAMRAAPVPVIARIQGKAVGGGVGLAAAADYAIATEGASLKLSELAVGIGPFVVGPVIERKIGIGPFAALSLDVEWRDAAWGLRHGLYAHVVKDIPTLDSAVQTLATNLSKSNPEAVRALKEIFWRDTEHLIKLLPERAGVSGRLILSEFSRKILAKN